MKISLVTSPHLDHSVFHRGADRSVATESIDYAQRFAPMGLISLACAVEGKAMVEIADINKMINSRRLPMSSSFYDEAAEWLLGGSPDLIGFMTETDSYHHLLRICERIKARRPAVLTALGGVHASAAHSETIRDFPAVDFIVRGEGEEAFRSVVDALKEGGDLSRAHNVTFRQGGHVVSTSDLPLISDLDTLPFPDFSRIELDPQDIIYVEIGRGCPFRCNFCFTAPYWQRKHRIKSGERVLRELRYFKERYGRTDFNFTHDLLTTDRRWVLAFCQLLDASGLNVTWTCSSRTDTIDEEQIYWMKRAGCRDIYFGVEAGTQEMQARIDKNLDLAEAESIITRATEEGIGATVGFIAGLPGESDVSLRGTLNQAFKFLALPGAIVHLFGFNPYRGSPHYDRLSSILIFDDHFVDFPLSEDVHAENCSLMSAHFEIFSRYSRLAYYEGLTIGIIRAADEFFPMVNALRPLMLRLHARGADPLDILIGWTSWIAERNRIRGRSGARLYQGAIADFLEFLERHLSERDLLDDATGEMIRWELRKDLFRSRTHRPVSLPEWQGYAASTLFTNHSLVVDQFEHAGEFLGDDDGEAPRIYAFYVLQDGTPQIARLAPITALVLDLAAAGVDEGALLEGLGRQARNSEEENDSIRTQILALVEQLKSAGMLVHPGQVAGEESEQRNGHEGIKPGYIPVLD